MCKFQQVKICEKKRKRIQTSYRRSYHTDTHMDSTTTTHMDSATTTQMDSATANNILQSTSQWMINTQKDDDALASMLGNCGLSSPHHGESSSSSTSFSTTHFSQSHIHSPSAPTPWVENGDIDFTNLAQYDYDEMTQIQERQRQALQRARDAEKLNNMRDAILRAEFRRQQKVEKNIKTSKQLKRRGVTAHYRSRGVRRVS
jgi:hypothetical protein